MSKLSILKQKTKRDVDMTQGSIFRHLITFAFPRKEQNFTKQAFMLPWLSIGNFTNLPTYLSLIHI